MRQIKCKVAKKTEETFLRRKFKEIKPGDWVILGRHNPLTNWNTNMEEYVGREAVVTRVYINGNNVPSVEVDANSWEWHIKNLTKVDK